MIHLLLEHQRGIRSFPPSPPPFFPGSLSSHRGAEESKKMIVITTPRVTPTPHSANLQLQQALR
jgi:hypothetical protein